LSVIERYADELGEMMKEFEESGKEIDFPHWWQAKIIKADSLSRLFFLSQLQN